MTGVDALECGNFWDVSTQQLQEAFTCSICREILQETTVIPACMHRFCKNCIFDAVRRTSKQCPICRTPFASKRNLRSANLSDKLIDFIFPNKPPRVTVPQKYIDGSKSHMFDETEVKETANDNDDADYVEPESAVSSPPEKRQSLKRRRDFEVDAEAAPASKRRPRQAEPPRDLPSLPTPHQPPPGLPPLVVNPSLIRGHVGLMGISPSDDVLSEFPPDYSRPPSNKPKPPPKVRTRTLATVDLPALPKSSRPIDIDLPDFTLADAFAFDPKSNKTLVVVMLHPSACELGKPIQYKRKFDKRDNGFKIQKWMAKKLKLEQKKILLFGSEDENAWRWLEGRQGIIDDRGRVDPEILMARLLNLHVPLPAYQPLDLRTVVCMMWTFGYRDGGNVRLLCNVRKR